MQGWQEIGEHRYRADGDVLSWRLNGATDDLHLARLLAEVDVILEKYRRSVLLVDCARATVLTAEARRRYAEWLKLNPYPHRASIFYSASGEMHAFLLLAQRGGQLLAGRRSAIEIVSDEAAAQQRARELRQIWAAGTG